MENLEHRVDRICVKAGDSWRASTAARSEVGVPIGVVAGLILLDQWTESDVGELIEKWSDEEIAEALMSTWSMFTILRPDLAFRCGPMAEWLNAEPRNPHTLSGAGDVARAASKAGLFEISADPQLLWEFDLLGHLNQTLSGQRDKQARGEFYTPGSVAELMGAMTMATPRPGESISDFCAGTGGLLRAAAMQLRKAGGDPAECSWWACDIDRVAVAAMAVNFHLWGLGPNVVIGLANTITEGDWYNRAVEEQRQAIEAQADRVKMAKLLAVLKDL